MIRKLKRTSKLFKKRNLKLLRANNCKKTNTQVKKKSLRLKIGRKLSMLLLRRLNKRKQQKLINQKKVPNPS